MPLLTALGMSIEFNIIESISHISIHSYPTHVDLTNYSGKSDWSIAS